MNKISFKNLDLDVYHEKLDNGLDIYIAPKNNFNNIYVNFLTRFGSNQREFVPINEKKMIKVSDGIAHFLEHKLFAQQNGEDPIAFFSERGAESNASTNKERTTYNFMGSDFFEENLNYLLDFVQEPYFTDKNVKEEKGIITEEINMYKDDVYNELYTKSVFNSFINHPTKYDVIGTEKSINSITKEDLYTCYNTFYHPANMVLVVTGNVIPEEVIRIAKKNQEGKTFPKFSPVKIKQYNEPDEVEKPEEILKMDINIPKVAINYKINIKNIKNYSLHDIKIYLNMYFESIVGSMTLFTEQLKNDSIINSSPGIFITDADSHLLVTVEAETKHPEVFIERIDKEIKKKKIDEELFEVNKKAILSSYIYITDNIYSINHKILNNIIRYNKLLPDEIEEIKKFNIESLNNIIKGINFDKKAIVIIKPKNN